jgi:hypothetical protein
MKPRNGFLENLRRKQEAATAPEPEAPRPEKLPSDPEVRAEYLSDELAEVRQELERERNA